MAQCGSKAPELRCAGRTYLFENIATTSPLVLTQKIHCFPGNVLVHVDIYLSKKDVVVTCALFVAIPETSLSIAKHASHRVLTARGTRINYQVWVQAAATESQCGNNDQQRTHGYNAALTSLP